MICKLSYLLLLLLLAAGSVANGQGPHPATDPSPTSVHPVPAVRASTPMGHPFEAGLFAGGGFAVADRLDNGIDGRSPATLHIASAGFRLGRVLTDPHGAGWHRNQFEYLAEFVPFWLASYPHQTLKFHDGATIDNFGYDIRGMTLTPVILRFNFIGPRRLVPWAQIGCGTLWTRQQFPEFKTSNVNYTPQVGFGTHFFVNPRQSFDITFNTVHISNGNTAANNPGVNVTLQAFVGYSLWLGGDNRTR